MSKYVKYVHQCDICECALYEATQPYVAGGGGVNVVNHPTQTPSLDWNFDTCDECRKELASTLENLKTIMQLKRQNGEAPAPEVKMTRKEWREAHRNEVEKEKAALKMKYEGLNAYDYETEDSLKFRLRKAEEHIKKTLDAQRRATASPLAMDPRKFGNGY